jgi:hypothetical protein
VKLTDRTLEGGAIRISMTGRRAVKLTQSPIPQHSFVQAVIATEADFANCFGAAVASTSSFCHRRWGHGESEFSPGRPNAHSC